MGVNFVQSTGISLSVGANTLQTGALNIPPTVGNYLVAWALGFSGDSNPIQTAGFIDTGGNSYTEPIAVRAFASADMWCQMAWAKVVTSGSLFKLTSNPLDNIAGAAFQGSFHIGFAEFAGVAQSSPVDGTPNSTSGASGSPILGNMTIQPSSLVVAIMGNATSALVTLTHAYPFIDMDNELHGNIAGMVCETLYAVDPGSPSNPSWGPSSAQWVVMQMALKFDSSATIGGGQLAPIPSLSGLY